MNKKILTSLLTIGVTLAMVTGATTALFSDTEVSSGNTLSAGTIDIAVDDENKWTETYSEELQDMKPSEVREISFVVKNVGTNPAKVWKHLRNFTVATGTVSEPECTDQNGTWDNSNNTCNWSNHTDNNNIDEVIDYDLYVGDYAVIHEDEGVPLSDVESHYIYLGELQPDQEMTVKQSYHMRTDTGNWAQGDELTFEIELYAEQTTGGAIGPTTSTLLMDNKDSNWDRVADGTYGILSFGVSGPTFDYNFIGRGLSPNTNYTLIYYADPWPGNNPGAEIDSGKTDSDGNLTLSGNIDLNIDLPDPSDANYFDGAKIWLIPSSYYNPATKEVFGWPADPSEPPAGWLFEERLIKYDDTDL